MIPTNAVTAWGVDHPWPTREQVEQDLLLSRAICAIAEDEYLGQELVFRGGTALHKLHLDHPYRYSEDLDYVRRSASGIAPLTQALSRLGLELGFAVSTRVSQHPKVYWRTNAASGVPLRIKIEVNTHERSPALPLVIRSHRVESGWWTGQTDVQTFRPAELIATKIRALYVETCLTYGSPLIGLICERPESWPRSAPTDPRGSPQPRHETTSLGSSPTRCSAMISTRS